MSPRLRRVFLLALAFALACAPRSGLALDRDVVLRDFRFRSGESMPELRIHVLTLGRPARDASGRITNAVMILHGTGGTGRQFMAPQFAGELFGAGQPLDTMRTYVILPDGIGHGGSNKPSDGLHMKFPSYGYADMVRAQYLLLTDHLGVRHLKLLMGTSMGGMHTWLWAETHPEFASAWMPLACLPAPIVGRNRMWRHMVVEAIRNDPDWKDGEYITPPRAGLRVFVDFLLIAGSAPLLFQKAYATRDTADAYVDRYLETRMARLDANDAIYQLEASRDYDPSTGLDRIVAPLLHINSADDFINPPELGIAEREIGRVRRGRFVLIPASEQTHGHGTHTWAALWKRELEALLKESAR
jgi:homoserine O-acetyltransferase/O-succinyltransferase